ncbi:MAG: inosine/xanthosine triphosphatase [Saprospiraceae bacterium]|nr:inosine/xanthosine triphosphatase [Saprospiraceae bacterium]
MKQLQVVIASGNPVKIEATQTAFQQVFQTEVLLESVRVASEVKDQPLTFEETALGAANRVRNARQLYPNAHFWVGIEGGVHPMNDTFEAFGWIYILSKSGTVSQTRSASFALAPTVAEALRNGRELGPVNDEIFKEKNSKHQGGAVGLLTHGLVTRTQLYVQPLILALIPFMQSELYDKTASET